MAYRQLCGGIGRICTTGTLITDLAADDFEIAIYHIANPTHITLPKSENMSDLQPMALQTKDQNPRSAEA